METKGGKERWKEWWKKEAKEASTGLLGNGGGGELASTPQRTVQLLVGGGEAHGGAAGADMAIPAGPARVGCLEPAVGALSGGSGGVVAGTDGLSLPTLPPGRGCPHLLTVDGLVVADGGGGGDGGPGDLPLV